MSDDSGRDSVGRFAPGNTVAPNTGGGYSAERQLSTGKLSARLQAASLARQRQIIDSGTRALLIELAGDFLAVADALKVTIIHARSKQNEKRLFTATQRWHTIAASAARQLQWLAEHAEGDGATSAAAVLEAIRGNDNGNGK